MTPSLEKITSNKGLYWHRPCSITNREKFYKHNIRHLEGLNALIYI